MSQKKSILKKILASKTLSYLLILFLIFSLVALSREISYRIKIKKQLNEIEAQTQEIEQDNDEFLEKIAQMQTEYFKEKAARLKLGLQKQGEQVIVVLPAEDIGQSESGLKYFGEKISNFKRWWRYFFK